jgi:hypothetical protein
VLTVGEIRLGIERLGRKDEPQAGQLEQCLSGLHAAYQDHLIPVDADVAAEWVGSTPGIRCGVALLNPFESSPAA